MKDMIELLVKEQEESIILSHLKDQKKRMVVEMTQNNSFHLILYQMHKEYPM
jgi:hypothetical protein